MRAVGASRCPRQSRAGQQLATPPSTRNNLNQKQKGCHIPGKVEAGQRQETRQRRLSPHNTPPPANRDPRQGRAGRKLSPTTDTCPRPAGQKTPKPTRTRDLTEFPGRSKANTTVGALVPNCPDCGTPYACWCVYMNKIKREADTASGLPAVSPWADIRGMTITRRGTDTHNKTTPTRLGGDTPLPTTARRHKPRPWAKSRQPPAFVRP